VLKPDPQLDDFEELWTCVCDPAAVDCLAARRLPSDWSRAIVRNALQMCWWWRDDSGEPECLERIFEVRAGV